MQSTKRSVFPLKKSIALIMALSVLVCGVFAACSSKKTDGQNSAADTTQAVWPMQTPSLAQRSIKTAKK